MTRNTLIAAGLISILLISGACLAPETPRPAAGETPVSRKPSPVQQAGWQERWESTVAEGRKEGVVNLYVIAFWGSDLRSSLTRAFKDKYGISLEFSPLSGMEFAAKVKAEQRAGLYLADVYGNGSGSFLTSLKPENLLGPMEPLLILPEVLDQGVWTGGALFGFDKVDKLWIEMLRVAARTIMYNTNLVRQDEINSFRDLLKPQFKGKIAMLDPADGSAGTAIVNHLVRVYGWDDGLAFFTDLVTRQEPAFFRDARLQVETVARGKYSVVLGGSGQYKAEFLALGAPLAVKIPREGDYGTASFGGIAIPSRIPHPNATTVFVNWLLTREGQSLFARGAGAPSRRPDASIEGIDPIFIPMAGETISWETPEAYLLRPKVVEAVKDIIRKAEK